MCHTSHSGPRVRYVPGWPDYVRFPAGTSGVQHRPHPVSVAAPPTVLLSPVTSQEGVNQMTASDNQNKQTTCRRCPDFVLSLSLLRLLTHLSLRVTGSSCPWRSSSTLCPSPPAPRPQAPTPRPPWLSTAPASPRISLRTPVRAPRWATVMFTALKYPSVRMNPAWF